MTTVEGASAPGRLTLNRPTMEGPWEWMSLGARDFRRAWPTSLLYGIVFAGIGAGITVGLWWIGLESLIPVAAACFALVGPVIAVGLYETSRRIEAGERVGLPLPRIASPAGIGMISFYLMFILIVWLKAAQVIYAIFVGANNYVPASEFAGWALGTVEGIAFLIVGTGAGAFLALSAFAIGALSIPMLMHRRVDAFTAIAASIGTLVRAPGPMLLWAWLIVLWIGFGLATGFLGLIVAFPLIGHATWHAYRAIVAD